MTKKLEFSIILPLCHDPGFLRSALKSLRQINFPSDHFEVLVVGGCCAPAQPGQALAEASVLDLASLSWRQEIAMDTPRFDHSATLLEGGGVLVVGGWNGADRSYIKEAEQYPEP